VLYDHKKNAVAKKVIDLEMAKRLREHGKSVIPGQALCRRCNERCEILTAKKYEKEPEINATEQQHDDDFHPYESPRKKLNTSLETMEITPVKLHSVAQHSRLPSAKAKLEKVVNTFKAGISSAYRVDIATLENNVPDDIEQVREKATQLDRLYGLIKQKITEVSYPEKIQILTLAPDENVWSRKYCAEYFNVSEYLVRTARDLKKSQGVLAKPFTKKGKKLSEETLELVLNFYEDDEYSRLMPGKGDYVSAKDENGISVHKQKRLVLCNLRELYVAFKEKNNNAEIQFSKFCSLRPKWCILAGSSGTHSVCVCSIHQNTILLVDALNWDVSYKDLIDKVVCDSTKNECMMHRCESCPGDDGLRKFLDDELKDIDDLNAEFHYSQWETTDRAALKTITTTYEEYKENVIQAINKLTRHSYLAKCQTNFLKQLKETLNKNEAFVLGDFAENFSFLLQDEIQSYHWSKEYCTLHPLVIYFLGDNDDLRHMSLCFISDDNIHDTSFVYQVQTITISHLKATLPHINKLYYYSDGCGGQYKNYKNFTNLLYHEKDFGISAEWVFFATSHGKSPCDGIGGAVKRHTAKRSLQRPLNNQIITYLQMLELCEEEMPSIKFFGISKEDMTAVRSFLQKRFAEGKTIPGTRSSHHFIPVSATEIGHKLTSEDTSFVDIINFNISSPLSTKDIQMSSYITCIYNAFWWVGLVTDVDSEEGDVQVTFMHPHGPRKTFNWPQHDDIVYVSVKNVICQIEPPTTSTGRTYTITDNDFTKTCSAFVNRPKL